MAGRGIDIRLVPNVAARGGLHVILTEFHEAAHIDRQLFGRTSRRGDPGSYEAIVALDDELFTRFAGRLAGALSAFATPKGVVLALSEPPCDDWPKDRPKGTTRVSANRQSDTIRRCTRPSHSSAGANDPPTHEHVLRAFEGRAS